MKVILFAVAIATTCVFAASYVDRMEIKEISDVYKQLVTKEDLLKFITEDVSLFCLSSFFLLFCFVFM